MDINTILAFLFPVCAVIVACVLVVRLALWALRVIGVSDMVGAVVNTPIIPQKVTANKGSLKHIAVSGVFGAAKLAKDGKDKLSSMLKSKAKAKKAAKVEVTEFRIWGK